MGQREEGKKGLRDEGTKRQRDKETKRLRDVPTPVFQMDWTIYKIFFDFKR
jgi:hypothetical protein